MIRIRWMALVVVAARGTTRAAAQEHHSVPVAAVVGTVIDSTSGRPPPRTQICFRTAYGLSRCSALSASGEYVVDRLPLFDYRMTVSCESKLGVFPLPLLQRQITIDTAGPLHRDWAVASSPRCDGRPLRTISRVFRGHYSAGFEESSFIPCSGDEWIVASDSLPSNTGAWVAWRGSGLPFRWPKPPKRDTTNTPIYVRWRATVIGPGSFGHMSIAKFEMTVDKVLETRWASLDDCRG